VSAARQEGLPLWNRDFGFGTPFLADPGYQTAYPLTWLNLLLRPPDYYKLFVLLHCWVAGIAQYFLARRLGMGAPGAFLAGSLWCVSGPMVSISSMNHHFSGAALMSVVLLALEGVLRAPGRRRVALLGGAAGLQMLAGSADMVSLTALVAAGRLAYFLLAPGTDPRTRRLRQAAGTLLPAAALAAAISAVQWLPTMAILRYSSRVALTMEQKTYWSVHPLSLLDFVIGRLTVDLPLSPERLAALFESREPMLAVLYVGVVGLACALVGLVLGRRLCVGLAVAALLVLLAALGRHTPLHAVLFRLPPLSLFRYPAKYMVPATLLLTLLCGAGFDAWQRVGGSGVRRARALALGLLALAACALALGLWTRASPGAESVTAFIGAAPGAEGIAARMLGTRLCLSAALAGLAGGLLFVRSVPVPRWQVAALGALAVADLAFAVHGRSLAPRELVEYRSPLLDRLPRGARASRLFVVHEPLARIHQLIAWVPAGWKREWVWALIGPQHLIPPAGARWAVESSFDGDPTGLAAPSLTRLSSAAHGLWGTPLGTKLLRMGNVGHMVTLRPFWSAEFSLVAEQPGIFREPVRLLRLDGHVPRVYVARGWARASDHDELWARFSSEGFDPLRHLIVTPDAPLHHDTGALAWTIRVAAQGPSWLAFDVELSAPGYLVVAESHHPDWRARVDGQGAKIYRVNGLFRGVPLAAGRHRVEMRYEPAGLAWGIGLSVSGMLALAGLVALERGADGRGRGRTAA
jgi:hypothetical protein